ncbi:MAG: sigma-70 family RNA polymerase sigma factor [Polyangiaceae bacterium]|nr:sigma-70 family RNA polymerase sigma factor [Polyangiaceae bacterium]
MNALEAVVTPDDQAGLESRVVETISAGNLKEATLLCAESYRAGLGRVCMAFLGNQAEAEDLVQDVLLDAYRSLPNWENRGSLKAYLFSIARRSCARHLEKKRIREQLLALAQTPEASATADESLISRQRAERARSEMALLKPTLREALVLRFLGELSFSEVASALQIDEATARQRVSRGLRALQTSVLEKEST